MLCSSDYWDYEKDGNISITGKASDRKALKLSNTCVTLSAATETQWLLTSMSMITVCPERMLLQEQHYWCVYSKH